MNKHLTFAGGLVQANRWSSRPGFSTSWFWCWASGFGQASQQRGPKAGYFWLPQQSLCPYAMPATMQACSKTLLCKAAYPLHKHPPQSANCKTFCQPHIEFRVGHKLNESFIYWDCSKEKLHNNSLKGNHKKNWGMQPWTLWVPPLTKCETQHHHHEYPWQNAMIPDWLTSTPNNSECKQVGTKCNPIL